MVQEGEQDLFHTVFQPIHLYFYYLPQRNFKDGQRWVKQPKNSLVLVPFGLRLCGKKGEDAAANGSVTQSHARKF